MSLIKWKRPVLSSLSPFRRVQTLQDEIDQLFGRTVGQFLGTAFETGSDSRFFTGWLPAVDLYQDKDNVVVKAELPGLKKDEIDISLKDGFLTITGERKEEQKHEDADIYRTERSVGRFTRSISLPSKVDADKIKATYNDGVLTVVLPKAEESKPKQIPISVN